MKCANVAFPLCRESVMGMPRLEKEFEFDMVFRFGMCLAPYAVFFFTRIYLQHIASLLKVIIL